jgi:TetR/AcrR family transcriptional regulator, transcriptional repressor for nem operon
VSQKGLATRDRLLAVADEVIYRRGYARASFEEIVAASGLRRGHINYYFRTKEDLLASVIERRLAEVRARLAAWDADVADPAERLRRFTEMVLGREADLVESGCPIGTLSSELGKRSGRRRSLQRKLFDVYVRWLARQIRSFGWPEFDSKQRAMEMLGRCQGAALLAHAYGDRQFLRRQIESVRRWIDETTKGPSRRASTGASHRRRGAQTRAVESGGRA